MLSEPLAGRYAFGILALVFYVTAVAACRGVASPELPGVYQVDFDYGIEHLIVRADGTYEQQFAEKGATLRPINQGRWETRDGGFWDGQMLVLHEPSIVDVNGHESRLSPSSGDWGIRIRKSWAGRVRLLINDDLGQWFEKVP